MIPKQKIHGWLALLFFLFFSGQGAFCFFLLRVCLCVIEGFYPPSKVLQYGKNEFIGQCRKLIGEKRTERYFHKTWKRRYCINPKYHVCSSAVRVVSQPEEAGRAERRSHISPLVLPAAPVVRTCRSAGGMFSFLDLGRPKTVFVFFCISFFSFWFLNRR